MLAEEERSVQKWEKSHLPVTGISEMKESEFQEIVHDHKLLCKD